MIEHEYELRLRSGRVVTWSGVSPEDAAKRYASEHRTAVVIATRPADRHGLHIGLQAILEPGDPGW